MIIRTELPNPIPWEYGYPDRQTGALWYSPTPKHKGNGDPQWNTRGEAGYYHDTPLGAHKLSWLDRLRLRRAMRALGQPEPEVNYLPPPVMQPQAATIEDVVSLMNAHNDRLFALTVVSTTAVAISALVGIFRTLRLIREGS